MTPRRYAERSEGSRRARPPPSRGRWCGTDALRHAVSVKQRISAGAERSDFRRSGRRPPRPGWPCPDSVDALDVREDDVHAETEKLHQGVWGEGRGAGPREREERRCGGPGTGPDETAVRAWVRQAAVDQERNPDGPLTTEEQAEPARLRRELKTVTMERDFRRAGRLAGRRAVSGRTAHLATHDRLAAPRPAPHRRGPGTRALIRARRAPRRPHRARQPGLT
jgi:hypothetical protein